MGLKAGAKTSALSRSSPTRHGEKHGVCILLNVFPPLILSNQNSDLGGHISHLADEDPEDQGGQVASPESSWISCLPGQG